MPWCTWALMAYEVIVEYHFSGIYFDLYLLLSFCQGLALVESSSSYVAGLTPQSICCPNNNLSLY